MNISLFTTAIFLCYHFIQGAELTEDAITNTDTNDEALTRVRRAGLSMLRLGRGLQMLRLGKRGLPMLRLGRSVGDPYPPSDRYLWSRQVPLPRYGKDLELQYLLLNALKNGEFEDFLEDSDRGYNFGYDFEPTPERQIRPAPRPGMRYKRSTDQTDSEHVDKDQIVRTPPLARYGKITATDDDKDRDDRVAPLMRYGKLIDDEGDEYDVDDDYVDATAVKRAMRMLRLGRGMRMLRLGKRPMESQDITSETDKRAMRMLRLGKRPFKMLRLGRSNNDEEKRALRLLRLGRRSDDENMS